MVEKNPKKMIRDNQNKTAVAIKYNPGEEAPKIIASGKGYVADKMLEVAKVTNVPIHKDESLARTLSKLEIGDLIPSELYQVVAEVLLFVDKIEQLKGKASKINEYKDAWGE